MLKKRVFTNDKQKPKMKKNALEPVDFETEKKIDPKFKTELCKSWTESNFCVYGNKCRFAHGKNELSFKQVNASKYKQKDCNSFKDHGWCLYGNRCNFKHDERKISRIDRSYYTYLLQTQKPANRRLPVFTNLSGGSTPKTVEDIGTDIIHADIKAYVHKLILAKYVFSNLSMNNNYFYCNFSKLKNYDESRFYPTTLPTIVELQSLMPCMY
jgi:hypothetical protein